MVLPYIYIRRDICPISNNIESVTFFTFLRTLHNGVINRWNNLLIFNTLTQVKGEIRNVLRHSCSDVCLHRFTINTSRSYDDNFNDDTIFTVIIR